MQKLERKNRRPRHWLVQHPRGIPIAIFLLVIAVTLLSVFAIERGQEQREKAELSSRAVEVASALERRANANSAYLRSGAALLASLDEIPAARFRRFVSELRLDADYRGGEGIGWAQLVYPDGVEEFDEMMKREAPGSPKLHPAIGANQPFAVPVTFLQPDTERNRRALGYDMYSDPARRAAMDEAMRTTSPTVSGKVVLQQEGGGDGAGFLMYMPVFVTTATGRDLKGFIYSPFNADDFLASALELEEPGNYGVRIYDGDVVPQNLLATFARDSDYGTTYSQPITIANHDWTLQLDAPGDRTLTGLSMVTLIFGLLVASLLMLVMRMLTRQASENEAALRWFEEQASIRNSLTRELNHRVKNTLANVLSIIALTRRRAENLEDFAEGLDGRIRALSATHDLLTQSDWGTTPIGAVVDAELAPYLHAGEERIEVRGPEIQLAPNDALSLGLAIHELATNAAKYGALGSNGGSVSVSWHKSSHDRVRLEWVERGGPPVSGAPGRGFGTDLIEKIVAHELGSPVDLSFEPEGVKCVMTIPVREPTPFSMRAQRRDS
ncbi:CHASE domain-containing protein [Croceibacterium aestuarii]|uniref:CHASE domain-containing protein n=1 Tax=Croceibacterium aestuarii TaxID=3064139 RepID=UPI00272EB8B4|nr:CHASE domain-containing protein [Croceibacterium sp. D39]